VYGLGRLARSRDQIDARLRAELGADEDAGPPLRLAFEEACLGAAFAGRGRERELMRLSLYPQNPSS